MEYEGGTLMASDNKICILCNKKYRYCGHCKSKSAFEPSWRNAWDTENCMIIFQTLASYLHGDLTAVDAKKKLLECDLSDKDSYNPKMRKAFDEIMAVEIPVEETPAEEDVEEAPAENSKEKKRNMKRKNN